MVKAKILLSDVVFNICREKMQDSYILKVQAAKKTKSKKFSTFYLK